MFSKWFGPLALLAALVIGDQIRINRPGHKYRLTVTVETPDGSRSASGVLAVHPYRGYSGGGHTTTKGDAVMVDLGAGKNLVALLAHLDPALDLDGVNYLALRAYNAARGSRVPFSAMSSMRGVVAVQGALVPVLVSFADTNDPGDHAPGAARSSGSGAGAGISPRPDHGRGGAEWSLAARFRGLARRAGDARHHGETAMAEGIGRCRGNRAEGGGIAGQRADRCEPGVHAEIASRLRKHSILIRNRDRA